MADKMGLVVMGIVTLKEGCVETIVNWQDIYEVAVLGIDPDQSPRTFILLPIRFPLLILPWTMMASLLLTSPTVTPGRRITFPPARPSGQRHDRGW